MTTPVRAALIGCGSLSLRGILPHLTQPDARAVIDLVAIADVVGERAKAAAEHFSVQRHSSDSNELLADDDIELVLVATPIPYHHELVMAALQVNKHVYVQKSMATTYAHAAEMVRTAQERGLVLAAAPGQLLAPAVRDARAFIQLDSVGPVYWAWAVTPGWEHEDEAPRRGHGVLEQVDPGWYYRAGGGPVYDTAVYMLHILTGILGPVQRVVGLSATRVPEREWQGQRIPLQVHDNTMLLLDFGDGVFAYCGAMSGTPGQLIDWGSFGVYGAQGFLETLEVEPYSGHPAAVVFDSPDRGRREVRYGLGQDGGWLPHVDEQHAAIEEPHVYADIMDCVQAIREVRQPVAAADHAAHVVEIMEQGYAAARSGRVIDLESDFADPLA